MPLDDLLVTPPGAREALALWLLAAVREVTSDGEVLVQVTADTAAVQWTRASDAPGDDALARAFTAVVSGLVADVRVPAAGACTVHLRIA